MLPKKIILLYHDVGLYSGTIEHFVSFQNFKRQIRYVSNHYEIVTLENFVLNYGNNTKQAVISFDDCFPGIFDYAVPYLQSLKLQHYVFLSLVYRNGFFWRDAILRIMKNKSSASLLNYLEDRYPNDFSKLKDDLYRFTKSAVVDSRDLSSWLKTNTKYRTRFDPIKFDKLVSSSAATGWTKFGVHTKNHYVMSSLNEAEQKSEILEVEKYLQDLKISYSNYFSLPFGEMEHLNSNTIDIIKELKYDGILMSRNRIGLNGNEPKLIERFMPQNTPEIRKQLMKLTLKKKIKDFWNC